MAEVPTLTVTSSEKEKLPRRTFNKRVSRLMGIQIVGHGCSTPERIVTNTELEKRIGVEPGWIEQRTGILERRVCAEHEATSDLAVDAAQKAIISAGVTVEDVDLLVIGTFTPRLYLPNHRQCRPGQIRS